MAMRRSSRCTQSSPPTVLDRRHSSRLRSVEAQERRKSVFLCFDFTRLELAEGLMAFLRKVGGFEVLTGRDASGYISEAVLQRIPQADYLLSLLTKRSQLEEGGYTTSPWLLEEKGVALGLGKKIVLLVEDGVTGFGQLQGDWQRIHFGPDTLLQACDQALNQLLAFVHEDEEARRRQGSCGIGRAPDREL
jgi:hypothetical protein